LKCGIILKRILKIVVSNIVKIKIKWNIKLKVTKDLEKKYVLLCKKEILAPGDFYEQINDLKTQIKQFHVDNFKGSQIRNKAKFLDNSEKPCKYVFRKETKKVKRKILLKLKLVSVLVLKLRIL
jgi:hypothetical protein